MSRILIYLLTSILFCSPICSQTLAGGFHVGNGGDGVIINKKVYLLDLVEAGLQNMTLPGTNLTIEPEWIECVESSLDSGNFPTKHIASKIYQIYKKNSELAHLLCQKMNLYNWNLTPLGLINVRDEDGVINLKNYHLVQLAVRFQNSIFIDQNYWNKLDELNKVALILHEIIYASLDPSKFTTGTRAREIVAYAFKKNFENKDSKDFNLFISDSFTNSQPHRIAYNKTENIIPYDEFDISKKITHECPRGSLIRGFGVRYASILDQIEIICSDLASGYIWRSGAIGGPGGLFQLEIMCPTKHYVSSLTIFYAKPYNNILSISDIEFKCKSVNSSPDQFFYISRLKQTDFFKKKYQMSCKNNYFLNSVSAVSKDYVESLSIGCVFTD